KLKLGVIAATGGIAIFYLGQFVLGFFGVRFAAINGSGAIGIGFSVLVVIIAALNLVLDFDFIENGARSGAPKYMEWYAAFGLMVTLVWLYLEILRLLSKINSRD
ncbi:MAG TPA: Bax inhibitor-1/YccA family protein, partial [Terriglobales bacterium]|nr:Bax inhibitor-1/YccA family protein [Terriglobales bacterium]